jgi:6-phosphogluconate dehydrogenase
MAELAQIGVTGLAVMGRNLARNFVRHGHRVAIHNRSYAKTESLFNDAGSEGTFIPSESMADFVASLERPRKVLIMVKAGPGTDAVIDELIPLLEEGDIVIDAGNAHFPDTIRREAKLSELGLHFVGTGVSGGEEGALNGPSIMPGGSAESYKTLGPLLESISAKVDGTPCCTYVGPNGAGHFVKMVHNGIEYADMQLIAEAYDLIKTATGAGAAEIGEIFKTWNEGDLESFLIEITAEVLGQVDAETGSAFVDVVLDQAEQKGTGRWTVQNALDLGVPITGIAEATFARALSGSVPQRQAAAGKLAAEAGEWNVEDRDAFVEDVRQALYASKVVAYSQGFDQIAAASAEFGWNIDRGAMARIWRGGCIIRARFLNRITEAYEREPDLALLLADDYFVDAVGTCIAAWRRVVAGAAQNGIPTPAFSSSLAYYDGIRAERLPAALIQAQRDFFGAHTYHRIDKDGTFHTEWTGDRSETETGVEFRRLVTEPKEAEKAPETSGA